jgi:hypothetical protein
VRRPGRERIERGGKTRPGQQSGERDAAKARAGPPQQFPSGDLFQFTVHNVPTMNIRTAVRIPKIGCCSATRFGGCPSRATMAGPFFRGLSNLGRRLFSIGEWIVKPNICMLKVGGVMRCQYQTVMARRGGDDAVFPRHYTPPGTQFRLKADPLPSDSQIE